MLNYQTFSSDTVLVEMLQTLQTTLTQKSKGINEEVEESLNFLISIINSLSKEAEGNLAGEEVSGIGSLGLQLFEKLYFDMQANEEDQQLYAYILVAWGYWIARQQGEIQSLEYCVSALAQLANQYYDKASLEALYEAATFIISAVHDELKIEIDLSNPEHPWKLLMFNYAIIATRSHTTELIESAYTALIEHFPEQASGFLEQAKSEMVRLNYPKHVQDIVERFYQQQI